MVICIKINITRLSSYIYNLLIWPNIITIYILIIMLKLETKLFIIYRYTS